MWTIWLIVVYSLINARGYLQDEEILADYGTTTSVSRLYTRARVCVCLCSLSPVRHGVYRS